MKLTTQIRVELRSTANGAIPPLAYSEQGQISLVYFTSRLSIYGIQCGISTCSPETKYISGNREKNRQKINIDKVRGPTTRKASSACACSLCLQQLFVLQ